MNNFSTSNQNKINGGLIFFVMIFAYMLLSLIGQALLLAFGVKEGNLFNAINSLFSILAIILAIVYVKASTNESCKKICLVNKFEWFYILPALLLSLGMFCGLGFLNYTIANLFYSWGLKVPTISLSVVSVWDLCLFTICLCVLPAVFEECFFRGVLLGSIGGKSYKVILALSFCFAIYHGNFVQFFYQLIYGFMLYLLAVKSKSIIPGIISHFINNFLVVLFTFINFNVNFFNPIIILVGMLIIGGFFACLILYRKKENCFNVRLTGDTSLSAFFIPFGFLSALFMTLLAVLGLF